MRVFEQFLVVLCLAAGGVLTNAQAPPAPPTNSASQTPQTQQPPPGAEGAAGRGTPAPPAPPPSQASIDAAAKVLAAARTALGGDAKHTAVTTLVATGRTRRVSGENLVPVEFEIDVELPDRYVRKDEIPARESEPSSSGFNADRLIQIPPPLPPTPPNAGAQAAAAGRAAAGGPGGPPAPAGPGAGQTGPGRAAGPPMTPEQQQDAQRRTRVIALKQDFAKLTLGMFATSFSSYPLTFSAAGQAEAPQGKADVIDVKGPGNFSARLFVMSDTHLPIMLSWTTPATPANLVITTPGQAKPATLPPGAIVVEGPAPPLAGASKDDQDAYAKAVAALRQKALAGKTIENRLYYSDYRDNDGLQFPFKLRLAVGNDTIEETTFDRFKLNAKIDAKKFEPVK
jgi:hypothetical protein